MNAHIRFLCPTCKAVMEAPVERAGSKTNCLKCGQRLQIPPPERAITVLAPILGIDNDPHSTESDSSDVAAGPPPLPDFAGPGSPSENLPISTENTPTNSNQRNHSSVPATLMVAASLLLLTYGGLLLFFGCSSLAITSTSAIRQERLGGFGQESRAQIALDFFSGAAQFLISALMIGSGVAAFRRLPIARWAGLSALAGQLLTMVISTALVFFFVNVQEQLGLIPGEGIMAIALVVKFFPYAIWLAFTVPIGILLNAPSARLAFADRPLFGIRFGGQDAPPDQ